MAPRIDPADLAPVPPRRPPGGAILDLHAHTSDRSLDSGVRVDLLCEQAKARGLDGICLTEHNATWPAGLCRELSERHGITVIPAMELGTHAGHVLVFGLERYQPQLLFLETLRPIVEYEGAAMVMAHPMRPFQGVRPGWSELGQWFDGMEVINGDHSDSEHGYLVRVAAELGVGATGGSDAHSRQAVGRVGTAFPEPVHEAADIARQIRACQTTAIDFRPGSPSAGK